MFTLLLQCYRSGQIDELGWQKHLESPMFAAWMKKQGGAN